ncbi:MAG: outer membrane beta-barrel protein [Bacteroidetes bacterium]|nr:outer membrane beta-barrel protein [Bacteroidota bacterium]
MNFFDQKFEVNPGVSFDGSKINSIVNTNKNITRNLTTGAELELALRLDSFEFAISTSQEYTQTSSTVSDRGNSNFFTRNYRASLSKDFKWKFTFETDAEFNTNTQRAQGYNVNFILWNASISKKFGKGENLIASFVATDMLNQNINTYRTVEDNVISDVKNTIIGRYLLLKVVYKFKNKGAEKEDDEE